MSSELVIQDHSLLVDCDIDICRKCAFAKHFVKILCIINVRLGVNTCEAGSRICCSANVRCSWIAATVRYNCHISSAPLKALDISNIWAALMRSLYSTRAGYTLTPMTT